MLATSAGLGFYGLSVYLATLNREKGFSISAMSGATAVFFIVSGAAGVGIARLLRSFDPRPIIVAGAVIAAGALAALGKVSSLWQVYVVYAFFGLGYSATALVISTTIVARWFQTKRAVALSVASTGLSVGGIVLTPVARAWLHDLRLGPATLRLAVLYLAVVIPVTLLLIRPDPAVFGLGVDGRRLGDSEPTAADGSVPAAVGMSFDDAVHSRLYWSVTVAFLLALGAQVGAIAQLVKLAEERIDSLSTAGRVVSILAACSVTGRLAGGVLLSRIGLRRFTLVTLCSQALGVGMLGLAQGAGPVILWSVVFGLAVGNVLLLHPLLLASSFGVGDYARIYGRSQFFTTFGVAGGPFLYGYLRDHAGGYRTSYLLGASLSVIGAVVFAVGERGTERS